MKEVKVTCSAGFLLLAACLIYLDGIRFFAQVMLVCVLHEVGHLAAALGVGSRVRRLRLTVAGAEMILDPKKQLSYIQDAILALSGPVWNLAVAWFAARAGADMLAGLNLCFGLLNLLPVRPLDGGRIMFGLLSLLDSEFAEKVSALLSILISGFLLGLGWAAWQRWGNLSLLCTSVWLMITTLKC